MRTNEERIARLHERAGEIKKKREKNMLRAMGGVCCVLVLGLAGLITHLGNGQHGITEGGLTGSSLLSDGAGGYVLVAVIAFAAGAAVALAARLYKERNSKKQ